MNAFSCFMARLLSLALLFYTQFGIAQSCSSEALTAKYWQYRKNFNKHFVMNDRKPEGCIGNGITKNQGDLSQLNCDTDLLHGYGLPATSIIMTPDGGHWSGMDDRNAVGNVFFNPNCANYPADSTINGTSYYLNPAGNEKHNVLGYGSETPHQLGWYLTVLATEYVLLGQNGQVEEQQRTLEDLFLALQAYRRLDIEANCLVKDRYYEITEGFETEECDIWVWNHHYEDPCLCTEKYHNHQCKGDAKWHFDIPCHPNCPWAPNLSGYSGFFIRADATQEQEALHDDSEDKWNIDLVGGAFAMAEIPPCDTNFSRTCYLEHHVGFMSGDQMFAIMKGLAMVKKYIPPYAKVTTCNGAEYYPLGIAQEIAKGIVELPQNSTRHIFWPGSDDDDCCYKAVKYGECAGGNLQWTYGNLELMYNYINPSDAHNIGVFDAIKAGIAAVATGNAPIGDAEFNYTINGICIGRDLSNVNAVVHDLVVGYALDKDKEIFLLINNLLYPGGDQLPLD